MNRSDLAIQFLLNSPDPSIRYLTLMTCSMLRRVPVRSLRHAKRFLMARV